MLSASEIAALLAPYLQPSPPEPLFHQLATYLDLLLRWNARTNLTAIRDPQEIVRRHFGESLFAAQHLPPFQTLLDFGSGAGFPGIPIQLVHPTAQITLAESQGKKASFLREALRSLNLPAEVWAKRVEDLPSGKTFQIVTLRAVDNMAEAIAAAQLRVAPQGHLAVLSGTSTPLPAHPGLHWQAPIPLPATSITLNLAVREA